MKKITLIAATALAVISLAGCSQSSKPVHHHATKTELVAKKQAKKATAEKAKKKREAERKKKAAKKAKLAKQKQAKLAAQQAAVNQQAQQRQNQQAQQQAQQPQQGQNQQPTQQQMINDPAKYSEQYRHSMASAEYRKWYYTPHYFDPDGNPITAQQHQELENQGAYNY